MVKIPFRNIKSFLSHQYSLQDISKSSTYQIAKINFITPKTLFITSIFVAQQDTAYLSGESAIAFHPINISFHLNFISEK